MKKKEVNEEEIEKENVPKRKEKKAIRKRKSKKEKENPISRALRLAVETGKVEFGTRKGIKNSLFANAKLIVVASNAPKDIKNDLKHYANLSNIPILEFEGSGLELGSICGKPFIVSVLSIHDPGNSDILELVKKKK